MPAIFSITILANFKKILTPSTFQIDDVFYEWYLNLPIIQGNSSVKFNYGFSYRNKRDIDCDIRENIINYEDEGGGEGHQTGYDLSVLRMMSDGTPALHAGQPNKMTSFLKRTNRSQFGLLRRRPPPYC